MIELTGSDSDNFMQITVDIPDEIAQRLGQTGDNLAHKLLEMVIADAYRASIWLFSTLCDNFCLWNREMLTEKDFYDYFAEETISIGFVSTQKPEEPVS